MSPHSTSAQHVEASNDLTCCALCAYEVRVQSVDVAGFDNLQRFETCGLGRKAKRVARSYVQNSLSNEQKAWVQACATLKKRTSMKMYRRLWDWGIFGIAIGVRVHVRFVQSITWTGSCTGDDIRPVST